MIVPATATRSIRQGLSSSQYYSRYTCRAASLNSAIHRGLRKSQGVGFRGKERSDGTISSSHSSDSIIRRTSEAPEFARSRARSKLGTAALARMSESERIQQIPRGKPHRNSRATKSIVLDRREAAPKPRSRAARFNDPDYSFGKRSAIFQQKAPTEGNFRAGAVARPSRESSLGRHGGGSRLADVETGHDKWSSNSTENADPSSSTRFRSTPTFDKHMPLSIPYTTPASEFLYGTSVVEAALKSRRVPRRKLYKFYVYRGLNREIGPQVAALERLAESNGVEVVRVGGNWIRIMDKMSSGRPHNGYILEASPLPRHPIASLGKLTTTSGDYGFEVVPGYQSREEAVINETFNFFRLPWNSQGRKPLILLLDSIVDPGNLGAIIRTAGFLGVTAVAISSHHSASFTPVVLKASTGAAENVTLFSVSKTKDFVIESKRAGWKLYAAVAPSGNSDRRVVALTTEELGDPLSEHPCILMLGSEGEGLRDHLQNRADVRLSIPCGDQTYGLDSLNVSVAAGILCNSFLKPRTATGVADPSETESEAKPTRDLF